MNVRWLMVDGEEFLNNYLPYVLRRAGQALSTSFYVVLAESNVGRSEWRVLSVLEDLGELSVLDLAEAALSPQPTVTHALRRLEARGFIQRTAGKDDKRNRFISITSTGSELTRMLMGEARRLETQALCDLGDLDELVVQLVELTEAIKQLPRAELEMGV